VIIKNVGILRRWDMSLMRFYEINNAIWCSEYSGYILECEANSEGACKYCLCENVEPNPDVYLCAKCYKGYDFKVKCVITERFLYK
jgi:hypothetical protein